MTNSSELVTSVWHYWPYLIAAFLLGEAVGMLIVGLFSCNHDRERRRG